MAKKCALWIAGILLLNHAVLAALEPTVMPVHYGQYSGAAAVGPECTLVTWLDYRRTIDLRREVFGTRVGLGGELLDGDGIPLTGRAAGPVAVAALRDKFLIVWSLDEKLYARRMTSGGELLDTQPIVVRSDPQRNYANPFYEFSVASDGVNFWITWTDIAAAPPGTPDHLLYAVQDICAARISPAGRLLDRRPIKVCARRGNQNSPRLSPNADFVVWSDYRTGRKSIFGARLHPSGAVLDYGGFPIFTSTNLHLTPANVAGNGQKWLVVWGDSTSIMGAPVGRRGGVGAPVTIGTVTERAVPQVQAAGQDFLVLWQSEASTVGARVSSTKQVGSTVTIASNGSAFYTLGGFSGDGTRFCVTGTTAPRNASWMYNDIWLGLFSPSMLP